MVRTLKGEKQKVHHKLASKASIIYSGLLSSQAEMQNKITVKATLSTSISSSLLTSLTKMMPHLLWNWLGFTCICGDKKKLLHNNQITMHTICT